MHPYCVKRVRPYLSLSKSQRATSDSSGASRNSLSHTKTGPGLRDQQNPTRGHLHPPGGNKNRDRPHTASLNFATFISTPPTYCPLNVTSCRLHPTFGKSYSLELRRPTCATHDMAQGVPVPILLRSKLPPLPRVGRSHHNQPPDTAETADATRSRTAGHTVSNLHFPTSINGPGNACQDENPGGTLGIASPFPLQAF